VAFSRLVVASYSLIELDTPTVPVLEPEIDTHCNELKDLSTSSLIGDVCKLTIGRFVSCVDLKTLQQMFERTPAFDSYRFSQMDSCPASSQRSFIYRTVIEKIHGTLSEVTWASEGSCALVPRQNTAMQNSGGKRDHLTDQCAENVQALNQDTEECDKDDLGTTKYS
jgi:hypothetical protein